MTFGLFENPVCCKISKIEGGPFGDKKTSIFFLIFKKKRKMRTLNSKYFELKYLKGETIWTFWHLSLLQNIKKNLKVGPFEGKIFEKKVAQCRKKFKEGTLQSRPLSQMLEQVSE